MSAPDYDRRTVEPQYRCPACARVAPWTDGQSIKTGDEADVFYCQTCGAESPLETCQVVLTYSEDRA